MRLRKKIREIEQLEQKQEAGEELAPNQVAIDIATTARLAIRGSFSAVSTPIFATKY